MQHFHGSVYGVAANVEGNLQINPNSAKIEMDETFATLCQALLNIVKNLAERANAEKQIFIDQVDAEIQTNSRLRSILIAGGIELLKILCPPLGIPIEMGRKWLETAQSISNP